MSEPENTTVKPGAEVTVDDETIKRLNQLKEDLRSHAHRYYVLDDPEVSDAEYDRLMKELTAIEKQYPDLATDDSPTKQVGAPALKKFETVAHTIRMLSLDNAFTDADLIEFNKRLSKYAEEKKITYTAEPKIDGIAVEAVYKNGRLVLASTRGDGTTGEVITGNVKTILSVPKTLKKIDGADHPALLEVRGEVYISKDGFEKLNRQRAKQEEPLFANPRNAAAGSLRQLDSKVTATRPLKVFFYALGAFEGITFTSHADSLKKLDKMGFEVNRDIKSGLNLEQVLDYYTKLEAKRDKLDYEIDGVVVKADDLELRQAAGNKNKSPRWAIAVKFAAIQETTRLLGIEIQIGRTGALTPVAHLEPVSIGGVTVSRASLHNDDEVKRKDVRIGDTVLVQRAGDVIPEVVKVIESKRTGEEQEFRMPRTCPECDTPVERVEGEAVTKCPNIKCPAQVKRAIIHFVSKTALDIDGLGKKLVINLFDSGIIKSSAGIFSLDAEVLAGLDRMGPKAAENIINAIEEKKAVPFNRFIYALGMGNIGEVAAKQLAVEFDSLDKLQTATVDDLTAIDGIGPIMAKSIAAFFRMSDNLAVIQKMSNAGVTIVYPEKQEPGSFTGKVFVITGTVGGMNRNQAKEKIELLGGKVSTSVGKKTDYLVAGGLNTPKFKPGSKYKTAQKLNIKILDDDDFMKMLDM